MRVAQATAITAERFAAAIVSCSLVGDGQNSGIRRLEMFSSRMIVRPVMWCLNVRLLAFMLDSNEAGRSFWSPLRTEQPDARRMPV